MASEHTVQSMNTSVRSIAGEDGQVWLNRDDLIHWECARQDMTGTLVQGLLAYDAVSAIEADAGMAAYQDSLARYLRSISATRWARAMTAPSAAVVIDTETTGLGDRRRRPRVIEVAVVDAHSGRTLLDTRVNPGSDAEIEPGASAVHGITMEDLTDAPLWQEVLPQLVTVTTGRKILAYNAKYDRRAIVEDCRRCDLTPLHLADESAWGCLMQRRSEWLRTTEQLALAGDHSALGDCRAAHTLLLEMTEVR